MDSDPPEALQEMEAEVIGMSILIMMLAAAVLMSISDGVEAVIVKHWKRTHCKRGWKLEGGWKR